MQQSLDDILFEKRNREYGSYWLRKRYFRRLLLSFIVALLFVLLLSLGFFWYLNTGGDSTVYLFPASYPSMKSTQGTLMDPEELASYMKNQPLSEQPEEEQTVQSDILRNFQVVEEASPDTFREQEKTEEQHLESNTGLGIPDDSTVFGGYLTGEGEGTGMGSTLDKFPEFPGGLDKVKRYIELTVNYPPQAVKQKINGVVIISFDVNKQGGVDNIKIEKSVHPMLDDEAVKAVRNMPPWKPGIRHGRPVIVKFVIPVRFMPVS
jgi:TonB family protein